MLAEFKITLSIESWLNNTAFLNAGIIGHTLQSFRTIFKVLYHIPRRQRTRKTEHNLSSARPSQMWKSSYEFRRCENLVKTLLASTAHTTDHARVTWSLRLAGKLVSECRIELLRVPPPPNTPSLEEHLCPKQMADQSAGGGCWTWLP